MSSITNRPKSSSSLDEQIPIQNDLKTESKMNPSFSTSSSKITEVIAKYGKVGLITHLSISWSIFGITYFLMSKTKNSQKIINKLGLSEKIPKSAGNLAISGIIYKAIMPARIALSLMVIPFVVKFLENKESNNVKQKEA